MVNHEPVRYKYQQHGILNLINYPQTRNVEMFVIALWLPRAPEQVWLLLIKNVELFKEARNEPFTSFIYDCKLEDEVAEFKLPKSNVSNILFIASI